MENLYKCPFCGEMLKKGNGHHIKKCIEFQNFIEKHKDEVYKRYYENEESMVDISNFLNISYNHAQLMFQYLGYPVRNIKESKKQKGSKEKYKKTMLKNWGVEHNFLKNCESRKKWERRLLETEGIINVFQREEVKEKIKKTVKNRYSDEEMHHNYAKGSSLEYWVEKLGEDEGKKRYDEICFNKGKSNRIEYWIEKYGEKKGAELYKEKQKKFCNHLLTGPYSGLNKKFELLLNEHNINYKKEYTIYKESEKQRRFIYDFLINESLIVELNGRFWHGDPRWYKENDILNFPGGDVKVSDLWEKDKEKKELALKNGYKFLTIWEDDFNNSDKEEIFKLIDYESSKNKESN